MVMSSMAGAREHRWGVQTYAAAVFAASLLLSAGACQGPPAPSPSRIGETPHGCRSLEVLGSIDAADSLTWIPLPGPELEPWCRGVGTALAYRPGSDTAVVDLADLAVVTWNVRGGGGDVDSLVADLRNGRLDGRPTESFVLLLQEVFRSGPSVPDASTPGAEFGKRVAPEPSWRQAQSIERVARRNRLHLLYVPSARNGGSNDHREDRGNAILSTMPLVGMEALELPLEKERRVALASRIEVVSAGGQTTRALLFNVHLDVRSAWGEFHRTLGAGRAEQARSIVEQYGRETIVLGGGDLNTWVRGNEERAARILRDAFPQPEVRPDVRTVQPLWLLPGFVVDHLLFRLPETMTATYVVIEDRYGSDHHPVIGRIARGSESGGGLPSSFSQEIRR